MGSKSPPNVQPVKKVRDETAVELEQQFILRMPPGPAMALRHDVLQGASNLKDKLAIELKSDMRHGTVRYGGQLFNAKLVDLPCIVESLKTIDRKTFYKTADLCQMLVCVSEDDSSQDEADSPPKKKEKDKKYLWNHGLAPPLKNVRKRRFRKTLTKKYPEQPDIEKEVKRLFRTDNEAIDVKWEVLVEGEDKISGEMPHGESNPAVPMDLAEDDIFGEISSSDDDEEKEVNIMDSGDDAGSGADSPSRGPEDTMDSMPGEYTNRSSPPPDINNSEIQDKLEILGRQIEDIRRRRRKQEAEIAGLDNQALQQRFQTIINNLNAHEEEKQKEYQILITLLNRT